MFVRLVRCCVTTIRDRRHDDLARCDPLLVRLGTDNDDYYVSDFYYVGDDLRDYGLADGDEEVLAHRGRLDVDGDTIRITMILDETINLTSDPMRILIRLP